MFAPQKAEPFSVILGAAPLKTILPPVEVSPREKAAVEMNSESSMTISFPLPI